MTGSRFQLNYIQPIIFETYKHTGSILLLISREMPMTTGPTAIQFLLISLTSPQSNLRRARRSSAPLVLMIL